MALAMRAGLQCQRSCPHATNDSFLASPVRAIRKSSPYGWVDKWNQSCVWPIVAAWPSWPLRAAPGAAAFLGASEQTPL
eukprot:15316129-Alexandrium_andersonii.AAC.1